VTTDAVSVVAGLVPRVDGFVRVAVDGVDGAGKTTFADALSVRLLSLGRPTVRVSIDDFHQVRRLRHARGAASPEGFWLDSYDYARFRTDVLDGFATTGSGRYSSRAHDLATDVVLRPRWRQAQPRSILIVDGIFLQRDELRDAWDLAVFLDVPFAESCRRMAGRDGGSPDPDDPSLQRYVDGQRLYVSACDPAARADVLVDGSVPWAPAVARQPAR
jgi:uridine kinase